MADNGDVPEKSPIDDPEAGYTENELDDSKAKFINGGGNSLDDSQTAVITKGSPKKTAEFTGLGKDELRKYSEDPFWVRLRWILFILFWVGWLAMLVSAIVIIVLAPRCAARPDLKWYHKDVAYNIYSKSFYDGDSKQDGYGDLTGIVQKQGYVEELNANAFWLSSIFKTDGNGNDRAVLDYMKLDEKFGTVEALRSFCKKLLKKGKRVIVDLIPNQTSKNHTWFVESLAKKDKYSNYYIWADAPNGWTREDGSSMWEKLPAGNGRDQYYLSQFDGLPDLNLTNPDVINEFKKIITYWADVGISGFHVNDMEMLAENSSLEAENTQGAQTHNFADNADVIHSLRTIVDGLDNKPGREKLLFGTVTETSTDVIKMYGGQDGKKGLHMTAVLVDGLDKTVSAKDLEMMMEPYINVSANIWLGWRMTTPTAGTDRLKNRVSEKRLIPAYALQALLPGTSLPYYGDEIGMKNGKQMGKKTVTPMQWSKRNNAGFTKGTPWLDVNDDFMAVNLEMRTAQLDDNAQMKSFKDLNKLRDSESIQFGKTMLCSVGDMFVFSRSAPGFESYVVVINMGRATAHVLKGEKCIGDRKNAALAFHSDPSYGETELDLSKSVWMGEYEVLVFKFPA